jgi:hypothetical protein
MSPRRGERHQHGVDRPALTQPDRIAGMVEARRLRCPIRSAMWYEAEQRQRRTGAPGAGAIRCRGDHL